MFSTPEDLAEKFKSDFGKRFLPSVPAAAKDEDPDLRFESTLALVRRLRLLPKTVNGRDIRLEIAKIGEVFPASRPLCNAFNLEYGRCIGVYIRIIKPHHKDMDGFKELYASGSRVDEFLSLMSGSRRPIEIHARLQFTPDDISHVQAEFFGYGYYDEPDDPGDPNVRYLAPSGKVILLFSKIAA